MFSRACPCLGRPSLTVSWDKVATGAPGEPLPFLYPRWFTSTLRDTRSIASIRTAAAPRRTCGSNLLDSCRSSVPSRSSSRHWVSTSAALRNGPDNDDSQPSTVAQNDIPQDTERSESQSDKQEPVRSLNARRRPITKPKRAAVNIFADIQNPPTISPQEGGRPGLAEKKLSGPLASLLPADTDLPPRRRAQIALRSLSPRDRKRISRRLFFSNQLAGKPETKSKQEYMAEIKDMLERLQQDAQRWPWKYVEHKELLVPEETVMLLTGATCPGDNIFHVPVHNGCEVRVLPPPESEGRLRRVILIGSNTVMGLVEERIKLLTDRQASGDPLLDVVLPPVPVYPSIETLRQKNHPAPLVRGVWADSRYSRKPKKFTEVQSMEGLTTVKEFAEFVEDLTMCKPSEDFRHASAVHPMAVAKTLVKAFRKEENQKLISSAALNQALSFLLKDHQFVHYARSILSIAQNVVTIDTFNILLEAAARSLDHRLFKGIIHSMVSLNIRPNARTWVAFLDCHVSPSSRIKLAAHLTQLGYITTESSQEILQRTIQEIFSTHLEHGKSVDSFFDLMINTYNVKIPPSLIDQMFKTTVIRRDYSAAKRLFDICEEHGFANNIVTLNELLQLFHNDISSALVFVLRLLANRRFKITTEAYERLFLLAFKQRCYNLCRVIWTSACTHRMVTFKMKDAVQASLELVDGSHIRNVHRRDWELNAGKVIVGIGSNLADYSLNPFILENLPSEFRKKPVVYLTTALKRPGSDPVFRRRLASALVSRDLRLGPWYRLSTRLHVMLEAAYVADLEDRSTPRPITWLMQNTIKVPLQQKYLNARGHPAPYLAI